MFKKISFYNYKNIINKELELPSKIIFVNGENGSGKSNLVSSVYFLSYGNSIRNENSIKLGEKEMSLQGEWISKTGELEDQIRIELKNEKKDIFVNEKRITDRKNLIGNFPCIYSSYEDFQFIIASPNLQRKFFDQSIILTDRAYLQNIRNYAKLLKNRNSLLRNNNNLDLLKVYDIQMAEEAVIIMQKRKLIVEEFNLIISNKLQEVLSLDKSFKIEYKNSFKGKNKNEIIADLEKNYQKDLKYKSTTKGIHRDKFLFLYNGVDFSNYASTGQIRVLSLFFRISQGLLIEKINKKKSVMVFDDVFLELDQKRRNSLLQFIPPYSQVFFTIFNENQVDKFKDFIQEDYLSIAMTAGEFKV